MTDRPIIFSAPMVRALLGGTKTQTRRVLKLNGRLPDYCGPSGCMDDPTCWGWEDGEHGDWVTLEKDVGQRMGWRDWSGAYRSGDRLWVKETWGINWMGYDYPAPIPKSWPRDVPEHALIYFATEDDAEIRIEMPRRPSIFMPRYASRLTLLVTDVRIERLQDISEADAVAEGCEATGWLPSFGNPDNSGGDESSSSADNYEVLWNSIHGPDAWAKNPWVVAITFDVQRRNIDA